jgi:hypothetical protein
MVGGTVAYKGKRIKIKNGPFMHFIITIQRLLACACLKPAGFVLAAPLHLALIWGPCPKYPTLKRGNWLNEAAPLRTGGRLGSFNQEKYAEIQMILFFFMCLPSGGYLYICKSNKPAF